MLFKNLFDGVDEKEILKSILEIYPEETNNILSYSNMIIKLKNLTPVESQYILGVVPLIDYFNNSIVNSVLGYNVEDNQTYALDLTHWDEWLGMEVSNKSLQHYGKEKFIACCLYEMSFISFDESEIDKLAEDLKEAVNDIETGNIQCKSSEEVYKELGIEIQMPTEEEIEQRRVKIAEIKEKNDAAISDFFS